MEKIVSFVVAAYNADRYLEKCLESFAVPSVMENIEVLIIDDGSTDHSREIAEQYASKFPNIYRVISKENGGHGSVINVGSKAASGKYLKIVDADDWVNSADLPLLINKLSAISADVVITNFQTIDMATGKANTHRFGIQTKNNTATMKDLVANWTVLHENLTFHGIFYKKSFYRACEIELPEHVFYEDQVYVTIGMCRAKTFAMLDLTIYEYLIGNSQQSVSVQNQLRRCGDAKEVAIFLLERYSELAPSMSKAASEFYFRKTQAVILNYLMIMLIINRQRSYGRQQANDFIRHFKAQNMVFYLRSKKKINFMFFLNYLGVNYTIYRKLLDFPIYRAFRRRKFI